MIFKLSTDSLSVTESEKTMRFTTVAGFVGIPTDKTPSVGGKHGWKFMLSEEGADEAVKGLVGMGVNCCWHSNKEFAKHDKSFKIGVIDEAHIEKTEIICSGYIWKHDFPDVCDALKEEKNLLGASVELSAGSVEDDEAKKLRIAKDIDFTGLSIVYKDKAAFYNTNFMCSVLEDDKMTEDEIKALLAKNSEDVEKKMEAKIATLSEEIGTKIGTMMAELKADLSAKDEPEKKPEDEPQDKSVDFSAEITKAIADGFAALKTELSAKDEKKDEPERKTKVDFSAFDRYGKDKNMMELSAEIDKDNALSAEQKWATKLNLWQKSQSVEA